MESRLKVRQPLSLVEVTLADGQHQAWLESHDEILREELNVKEIRYSSGSSPYIEYQVQPNFRKLGPKLGALLPKVKQHLAATDGSQLLKEMTEHGKINLHFGNEQVSLDGEDIQVRLQAKSGWAAAQGKNCVVVLATELSQELVLEGIANDLIRGIQDLRKKSQLQFTDRIAVAVQSAANDVSDSLKMYREKVMRETLAIRLELESDVASAQIVEAGEHEVLVALRVANPA